ncbi:MAG TPA: HAD family hydrolase [Bryobacteraceae bacterium]|nr:HAD family hydrolase [Bryobacteraceae bacterium]
MEIRALLFDVNGTLIDIETDEWMEEAYRAIAHFLTYQGIALHRGEVRDLYFRIMKEQFAASAETYPEFDVVAVWSEVLRRCATDATRSLGLEKLRQMPLFLAELQRGIARKRLAAFPQVQEILAQLKTRYRLAAVSDAQSAYALPELRAAGLAGYFGSFVVSGDYGYRKPDPRLFQAALTALQVGPEEAIFIGDDRFRDVLGARQVGMKTILFCPRGNQGGSPETEPDYILYQYAELPRAIEFLAAAQR